MNIHHQITRRSTLAALGLALTPAFRGIAWAQEAPAEKPLDLPLKIKTICGHCGVSVPDVTQSALFYSKLFGGANVTGEKQPFLRYMINLGGSVELGGGGGVAIGKLGTLGGAGQTKPLIDHFCFNAEPFDDAAWRARLKAEGLVYHAQGVFSSLDDIAVQISGAQGGESLAAGKIEHMDSLYTGEPLVRPGGFEHIMLHVSNLDQSVAFYEKMFGLQESERRSSIVYFTDGQTRLAMKQVAAGEKPNINHYAVKVPKLDHSKVTSGLPALGATLLPASEESKNAIRFADPDGLIVELWPK
jgi:catechol 2,3-dioxygenase-like lactoylglutathione lyase family enzyme